MTALRISPVKEFTDTTRGPGKGSHPVFRNPRVGRRSRVVMGDLQLRTMDSERKISVVPAPGEPHRQWRTADPELGPGEAVLLILASDSKTAVSKLIAETGDLTKDEIISLGRLNFHCFLQGYEPMVMLFREAIKIDPAISDLIGDELNRI